MIPTIDIMPDGSVRSINPIKLAERPFWLTTDYPNNSIVVPPQVASSMYLMSTNLDGPIDVTGLAIQSSGNCLIQMGLFGANNRTRLLSQSPIHSATAFGTGAQPYPLPEVLRINQLQKLAVWITNLTQENNTVRLCVFGRQLQQKIYNQQQGKMQRQGNITFPYFMTLDGGKVIVPASGSVDTPFTMGSNLDFQLFQISGVATSPLYTINILDADTGESMFSAPADKSYGIQSNLVVGSNVYPFRFNTPRLVKRGQRLIARLTDTSTAENTIYLTLGGRAVFRGESAV